MTSPKIIKVKLNVLIAFIASVMMFAAGCNNNPVTETTSTGTGSTSDNISLSMQGTEEVNDNADVNVTEAKGLLTEIELENNNVVTRRIQAGPIVMPLNVAGVNSVLTSGIIPAGTYTKIKFQLHKPEDNETIPDPEFRTGSSGNQRYSFIIKGTYNGSAFVYKSRKTINIVLNLSSPLNLTTKSNVTVLFKKIDWFRSGGVTFNPNDDDMSDVIDDNIKNSFKRAFKDDDRNGIDDNSN